MNAVFWKKTWGFWQIGNMVIQAVSEAADKEGAFSTIKLKTPEMILS